MTWGSSLYSTNIVRWYYCLLSIKQLQMITKYLDGTALKVHFMWKTDNINDLTLSVIILTTILRLGELLGQYDNKQFTFKGCMCLNDKIMRSNKEVLLISIWIPF